MKYFLSVFLIFNLTLFSVSAMLKPPAQAQMDHIICHCADMKKDSTNAIEYMFSCSSSEKNAVFHMMQLNVIALIPLSQSFFNRSETISTQYSSSYKGIMSALEPPPPRLFA